MIQLQLNEIKISCDFFSICWANQDSRNMLIFFAINLIFMFLEMAYGVYSNSLGLISDSFHMLSDCFFLLVALATMYVSVSGRRDQMYTYGYARAEVLSGLFNGIFLVFVSFNMFFKSIERIYEP
jgi:zinc transporter 5/7